MGSPFLLTPTLAPLEGRGMGLRFVFLLFPALALAQDRYQTDLQDQYQNDPYQAGGYQAGPYQEDPYQEPYKVPTHYQTKKKQYQLESYQEPYVEEEHTVPKPFAYQYGGVDAQGLESSKVENQGEDGVVRGEYRVQLPDGRTQIVSYTADEEHGYQAEVIFFLKCRTFPSLIHRSAMRVRHIPWSLNPMTTWAPRAKSECDNIRSTPDSHTDVIDLYQINHVNRKYISKFF